MGRVIHGKKNSRIIEIEWAFKNNKHYVPSPKLPRKSKNKKKVKSHLGRENVAMKEVGMGVVVDRDGPAEFGMELTNTTDSPSKSKRSFADTETVDSIHTPPKRQKRMDDVGATPLVNVSSDDDDCAPPAVVKKTRRKVVVG